MNTFSTLSPIPGFRTWLLSKIQSCKKGEDRKILKQTEEERLISILQDDDILIISKDFYEHLYNLISNNSWIENELLANALQTPL